MKWPLSGWISVPKRLHQKQTNEQNQSTEILPCLMNRGYVNFGTLILALKPKPACVCYFRAKVIISFLRTISGKMKKVKCIFP